DYLESFPGAVLAVSHDRYFLDKIAGSIFEVTDTGAIRCYTGNYADYAEKRPAAQPGAAKRKVPALKADPVSRDDTLQRPKKLKFSFKEQQEFDVIDGLIAALESQIDACAAEILTSASDYVRLQALMEQKRSLEADLEAKTERWVYLNDLAERIDAQK
ncbi:MAG: ABC transporter ATP-binding protein, partial [Oscillospiraceae bacterium]